MRHTKARASSQDITELLPEAQHLHQALSSLHLSIESSTSDGTQSQTLKPSTFPALALCCSARLVLYNQYACNEPLGLSTNGPIALETELQKVGLEGIRAIASSTARLVARDTGGCPFVTRFLYHAATECAWFIKENHEQIMYDALEAILGGLRSMSEHWRLASKYELDQLSRLMLLIKVNVADATQASTSRCSIKRKSSNSSTKMQTSPAPHQHSEHVYI